MNQSFWKGIKDGLLIFLTNALGILLYAMFIAIIIPQAHESFRNLLAIVLIAIISCSLYYGLPSLSGGFRVIISSLLAACVLSF